MKEQGGQLTNTFLGYSGLFAKTMLRPHVITRFWATGTSERGVNDRSTQRRLRVLGAMTSSLHSGARPTVARHFFAVFSSLVAS
jgi:hypothetical protein